jgi:hypothetical protein
MLYRFSFNDTTGQPATSLEVQQLDAIHNGLNPEPPEMEVFPLRDIPVECEDAPIHDGVSPCGDPDCYCAHYGYGVPSLPSPRGI